MGKAIARFREMALAIRCRSDAAFIAPDYLFAGMVYTLRNLSCRLLAGRVPPAEFATILRDVARSAPGIKGAPSAAESLAQDRADINRWFAPYRRPILAKAPSKADLDKQHAAALREAVRWGELLPFIEKRLDAVSEATLAMREMAEDAWLSRYSRTKQRYAKTLLGWQRDFDALAVFVEEPPAPATTSEPKPGGAKQAKRRDRKGIGGRPEKFTMKFIREVVAARKRDQKHAQTSRRPLPPIPKWLSGYCTEKGINIREMFPPHSAGEAWNDTANRFWKAATKRLREAETNCH